jgi:CHAT domain-containing protein/Tfp pilus assembly protein PilF
MKRITIALALLLATACTRQRAGDLNSTFEQAQEAFRLGDAAGALRRTDDALGHLAASDESELAWRLRLLRVEILITRREFSNVEALLKRPIPDNLRFASVRARQRYLDARVGLAVNDLGRAMAASADARSLAPDDLDIQVDADLLEGQAKLLQRNWESADDTLNRGLDRASKRGDGHRQLLCLNNLGMSRLLRSRYDEALVFFERALTFSKFEETTAYALTLSNAGICYSRLGLFDFALSTQKRAVAVQRARGTSKALAEALGSLGNTHLLRGNAREALPYLHEAFAADNNAGLKSDAAVWAVNLAAAHASLGEWDQAERFNEWSRAVEVGTSSVRHVYADINAADIAVARGDHRRGRALYERALVAANGVAAIEWTAHAGLAQIAVREQQPQIAARHFEAALGTVERTRSDLLKTDYKLSFLTQLIEFYQSYVDALVTRGQTNRALEIAESSRGRLLAERQRVNAPARANVAAFQDVARRTRTVLLSYWLAPKRSFLWVVSGAGVRRIDLPPGPAIEAAVRDYRAMLANSLANPLASNDTPGDRLFHMLVAPAALPRNASVVIVPDGALYSVNFETLPVDHPHRHYWIDDAEVQVAPSLSMLTAVPKARAKDPRLLLIGNPTPRAPEFPRLSYALGEMTSIVRHFPPDHVAAYDDKNATPEAYRDAQLEHFSMIHFTAHAAANVESPLESAVVLSGPDTGYKLYARDVADKPLNADLVTVSACRSAGERTYSGEGLVGFAWAFLRAGARRVIAGLWDVDDRSTARLMDELYGGMQAGHTPAQSLRDGKLALMKEGGQLARPYYWGPFQLFTVAP